MWQNYNYQKAPYWSCDVNIKNDENYFFLLDHLSYLMRLWYLSHRRPVKAQVSLCICAVSPEPLLFAHMACEVDEGSDQKSDI